MSGNNRRGQFDTVGGGAFDAPPAVATVGDGYPVPHRGKPLGALGTIYGEYGDATINDANCGMLILDTPINGMRSMTFNLSVEMNAGARVENWNCYAWDGSQWVELGTLYVPGGNGSGSCTFTGDGTQYISHVAVVPTARGNYSYRWGLYLTDVS